MKKEIEKLELNNVYDEADPNATVLDLVLNLELTQNKINEIIEEIKNREQK